MDEVSKNDGRTILFVSHNLAAVNQLCNSGILLRQGNVTCQGEAQKIVHQYISYNKQIETGMGLINLELRKGSLEYQVDSIEIFSESMQSIKIAKTGEPLVFEILLNKKVASKGVRLDFAIDTEHDMRIGWFSSSVIDHELNAEFDKIYLKIPKLCLGGGLYYLTFYFTTNGELTDFIHQGFAFEVEEGDYFGTGKTIPKNQTFIYQSHEIFSN